MLDDAEGVRLLFLDLDGVICCNYYGELESDKLDNLKHIIEQTGAKIVLSTDWRRQPHLKERATQTIHDLGMEVIGATPEYAMYSRVRPKEILAWLSEYKDTPVAGWCAVDDRDLVLEEGGVPHFTGHFVLTEFATGLTAPLADRTIDLLCNREPRSSPAVRNRFWESPTGPSTRTARAPAPARTPAPAPARPPASNRAEMTSEELVSEAPHSHSHSHSSRP